MILRQKFSVAGVASDIAYDTGLKSTQAEKKRLVSIGISVNNYKDNDVQGYWEKAKIFEIPDRLLDMEEDGLSTNRAKPGARINDIEVGIDLPVGEVFKIAIKCGAVTSNMLGTYNYEIITG